MSIDKSEQHLFSDLKHKLFAGLKNGDNSSEDANEQEQDTERNTLILKESYYNLLCAILDPSAHVRKIHNFQKKTFGKPTNCEECHSILWGIEIVKKGI